jgi:hypothetical protein
MDVLGEIKAFAKDSVRLVKRCTKPDAKGERGGGGGGGCAAAGRPARGAVDVGPIG